MLKIAKGIEIVDISSPIIGKLQHAHCSSVVSFKNGTIFVAYFHAVNEAHHTQCIFGRKLVQGETNWSEPFLITEHKKLFRFEGNPVLWIAPDTKKLFLFYVTSWGGWSTCILRYKTSTDQGKTWSNPKKVHRHISRLSKNPPIMLENGNYLLPATIEFRECTPLFYLSDDQGKTWRDVGARIVVPEKYWPPNKAESSKFPERMLDQPTVIQRKDGTIYCLMRAYRPLGKMYETLSHDGGKTWSKPKPALLPNPDGGFHMIKLQSGNIFIIYNHSSEGRNPLSVALSEDGGRTWKYRRNLCEYHPPENNPQEGNDALGNQKENFQYPTCYQANDGVIHISWSHGYSLELNNRPKRITDIQYTSITEDWVREELFSEETWLL